MCYVLRASEGYLVDAIGFLVKPDYSYEELSIYMEKVRKKSAEQKVQLIKVGIDSTIQYISLAKTIYAESSSHDVILYTEDKTYRMRRTLASMLDELGAGNFVQIHRAYIVATHRILRLRTVYPYSLELRGKHGETMHFNVGRTYIDSVQKAYVNRIHEGMME